MIKLRADDPRLTVSGHAELVADGDWLMPCRLPVAGRRDRLTDQELLLAAYMPSGVAVEFRTDARGFEWDVRVDAGVPGTRGPAPFDVVVDGRRIARTTVTGPGTLDVTGLPEGRKQVLVWLPQYGTVRLGPLRLAGATTVTPPDDHRLRWLTYGSSLTHCTGAEGPSETWPALVAAEHRWRLWNLGFAGQCHLDPVVARFMRDKPADVISLCVGVNIHGRSTFSARSLRPALTGFVETVRDGHPRTPLLLITPMTAPDREAEANAAGLTLARVRSEVAATAHALRAAGDAAVHLVDGPEVVGPGEVAAGMLHDGLHPTAEGYRLMAARLAPRLRMAARDG